MTIEDYCKQLHPGQWFSFDGKKTLDNLVLTDFGKSKGYSPPTQAEFDAWKAGQEDKEAEREKKEIKRQQYREEIKNNPPPNSMPGLAGRVEKLEIAMGLREPDISDME